MATKERAAHTAVTEAQAQLARRHTDPQHPGDAPAKRCPGRPSTAPVSLEHAEPALDVARRAHERRAQHRVQVTASLRGMGHEAHCVDLERGGRRHGPLRAAASPEHRAPLRTMAPHAGRSPSGWERSDTAARVVPNMHAPSAFVSGDVGPPVAQRAVPPPVSVARPAQLRPSYALARVAQTRTVSDGAPLRERAERLRTPVFPPGGVCSA
jgi:hypothetical protein